MIFSYMDSNKRFELIERNTAEIIGEEELKNLLKGNRKPVVYCGYETSGDIHLGHLVSMTKLLDFHKAGFKVKVLFADWHTYLNTKGDWKFINEQVKRWEKGFRAFGIKADFVKGSKFERDVKYIDDVFSLALKVTLNRGLRSMQTIARNIDDAKISQVIYPLMQIVDFKYLKVDGALGGIEQRKIHMLALEDLKEIGYKKPFFIHHELIPSLKGKGKMSSSVKESMISIKDSEGEIRKKLNKAHCPEGEVNENPVLMIAKLIVFPKFEKIKISRPEKFGGSVEFKSYSDLEEAYSKKELHPMDLKNAVAENLVKICGEIRKNFK